MKKIIALVCVAVLLALALVSCGPNLNGMAKKLEKEGYEVTVMDAKAVEEEGLDNEVVKAGLTAVKMEGLIPKTLIVIEFKTEEAAEDYASVMGLTALIGGKVETEGKVVYVGPQEAIDIVK